MHKNKDDLISGKVICIDRGDPPDGSDRHLVLVVGVMAIPKDSPLSKEIKDKDRGTISVGMLIGYNGGLTLTHLENLGLPEDRDDMEWLRKEGAAGLITNYGHWQV